MSWSVSASGKVEVVKRHLTIQFEHALKSVASVPAETKAVVLAEQIANVAIEACKYNSIAVSGYGFGSVDNPPHQKGGMSFNLSINSFDEPEQPAPSA